MNFGHAQIHDLTVDFYAETALLSFRSVDIYHEMILKQLDRNLLRLHKTKSVQSA